MLECPVCIEHMRPPIRMCVNGHNICDICRPKLFDCPTCRKRFLSTRNLALERLTQDVKYPCTYRKFGCKEVFARDKLGKHAVNCRYRQVKCPAARSSSGIQCDWTGNYNEVKNHLMENHLEMCVDYGGVESRHFLNFFLRTRFNKFVFLCDELFSCQFCERNGMIFVVVQYIGPPKNAAKYKYEVKFINKDNTEGVTVMHLTRSFDENVDDIFTSGNCGKLHCDVVNRLKARDTYIKFKLEILAVGN